MVRGGVRVSAAGFLDAGDEGDEEAGDGGGGGAARDFMTVTLAGCPPVPALPPPLPLLSEERRSV